MQTLKKILEEIDSKIEKQKNADGSLVGTSMWNQWERGMERAKDIIRKHMNDGWIPVEEALPEDGVPVLATIKNHEWISDYDCPYVDDSEKTYHPEYFETTLAVCDECGFWRYAEVEFGEIEETQADYKPSTNLYAAVSEVIAWRPLPEPYKPERSDNNDGE